MVLATDGNLKVALTFDPIQQSIQALIGQCQDDWGAPENNRELLLPYGIKPLDKALYGMDIINGELILVQGAEKNRKSTLVANIIVNYMMGFKPTIKPVTVIDSLESGMTPKKYRDTLISMVATRYLLDHGHKSMEACPACEEPQCQVLGITPKFLRYNTRKAEQVKAIEFAINEMSSWPMYIFGAAEKEGDTRNLQTSVTGKNGLMSRWEYLINEYNMKVVVTDHLQQYSFDTDLSDYEKQVRTVAAVSDVVSRCKVVALEISQISLTSQRDAAAGVGKEYAAGGRKAAAEANSILQTYYEDGAGVVQIDLKDSRDYKPFSMEQPIEPRSGCFFGEATILNSGKKVAYHPGDSNGKSYRK